MIVTCQSCGSNERLPQRLLAGRTAVVRCKLCRGLMLAETLSFETRRWWAVIGPSVCGPYTSRELKALVEHGEIHGGSYLWTWDMPTWQRVHMAERLAFVSRWVRELHDDLTVVMGKKLEQLEALDPDASAHLPVPSFSFARVQAHAMLGVTALAAAGGFFAGSGLIG
jgi:hypothetical protein